MGRGQAGMVISELYFSADGNLALVILVDTWLITNGCQ